MAEAFHSSLGLIRVDSVEHPRVKRASTGVAAPLLGIATWLLLNLAGACAQDTAERASAGVAGSDSRFAIPSQDQRRQAESQIREVFADSLKSAKTAEDRLALSRKLESQAVDENNTPDVRYAAFELARSLAVEAGDVSRALSLVALTGEYFAIHPAAEKAALLKQMSDKGSLAVRAQALAAARRELDELMQGESYPEAAEMGRVAFAIAKLVRDKEAQERIAETAKLLRQRQAAYAEVQSALARLKDDPADKPANLIVGRWSWFVKNDLPLGLQHLAASGDKRFSVAVADLAGPKSPKEQREVADQWRATAGQEEDVTAKRQLLLRAQFWYQKALSGTGGLEKARLEKYLAEVNEQLGSEPAKSFFGSDAIPAGARPGKSAKLSEESKADWKPPQRNANTAFRSFLGIYMYYNDTNKLYPVVNLQVPNKNLWTPAIQDKVRGRITFDEISYLGTASMAIPADGVYVLSLPSSGKVSINGIPTGGEGELKVVKGIHRVTYEVGTHGQPYIVGATISLRHRDTGEEVVFFNSWKEIQAFLATPIGGQRVLEVSDWKPSEADEVKVNAKSLKVTVGGR